MIKHYEKCTDKRLLQLWEPISWNGKYIVI